MKNKKYDFINPAEARLICDSTGVESDMESWDVKAVIDMGEGFKLSSISEEEWEDFEEDIFRFYEEAGGKYLKPAKEVRYEAGNTFADMPSLSFYKDEKRVFCFIWQRGGMDI